MAPIQDSGDSVTSQTPTIVSDTPVTTQSEQDQKTGVKGEVPHDEAGDSVKDSANKSVCEANEDESEYDAEKLVAERADEASDVEDDSIRHYKYEQIPEWVKAAGDPRLADDQDLLCAFSSQGEWYLLDYSTREWMPVSQEPVIGITAVRSGPSRFSNTTGNAVDTLSWLKSAYPISKNGVRVEWEDIQNFLKGAHLAPKDYPQCLKVQEPKNDDHVTLNLEQLSDYVKWSSKVIAQNVANRLKGTTDPAVVDARFVKYHLERTEKPVAGDEKKASCFYADNSACMNILDPEVAWEDPKHSFWRGFMLGFWVRYKCRDHILESPWYRSNVEPGEGGRPKLWLCHPDTRGEVRCQMNSYWLGIQLGLKRAKFGEYQRPKFGDGYEWPFVWPEMKE